MANQKHVLEFSPDGKLFAVINNDGKLLVWDTETSELKQTYSISTNTNANCTALTWVQCVNPATTPKQKRRSSGAGQTVLFIAIGTFKGKVLLYSYAKGEIQYTLKGNGHTGAINGVYYDRADSLYTCGSDFNIIKWSISQCVQVSSMKIGNEIPYSLTLYPESKRLLTAGRQLKLWNMETEELIQTYTGHTSNILLMNTFNINNTDFAITGANSDRILSMWCLDPAQDQKNSIATFLMEDVAICIRTVLTDDNVLRIAAVTRNGVIHYYREDFCKLKVTKPIKPKVTLEIVSDSTTVIEQIPVIAANLDVAEDAILLGYGDKQFLRFESIVPEPKKKKQIEIRVDPRKMKKQKSSDKETGTLIPIVDHDQVEYFQVGVTTRKTRVNELPMETRLENLKVSEKQSGAKNMAQLLIQALHSKDASMLRTVFQCNEESTIQLTLERLPPQYTAPLIDELCILMRKKTTSIQIAVTWLKYLLQTHASQLMALGSNELFDRFGPCMGIIESRINNLQTLYLLRGRLDLLTSQLKNKSKSDGNLQNPNLLVYEDEDSSKEMSEVDDGDSESSDDQWEEETDDDNDKNAMEVDQNNGVEDEDDDGKDDDSDE